MSDDQEGSGSPAADRAAWLTMLRRDNQEKEDALALEYDERWGDVEPSHRAFVERFLSLLPPEGKVLDAACGTGKYFGIVLAAGHSTLGVDHAGAYLTRAQARFPQVPTEKRDLQELAHRDEFAGVMCVDAMEFVPPEEWPAILERFRLALHQGGWLYLTVELAREDRVRAATEKARTSGLPVVEGEVIWEDEDTGGSYYHHHPAMERVRAWLADAGFAIVEEAEGPWHDEGYAYHHVLARSEPHG